MTQDIATAVAVTEPKNIHIDLHPGQATFETNGCVAMPGDTGQLYYRFAGAATLQGFVVDEGGELVKIIAGQHNIGPQPDGSWKFGQTVPVGAYCIAIVKNVTKDTKTLKGAFLATEAVQGVGVSASPQAGSLTSPNVAATNLGGHGQSVSPRPPHNGTPTVTPGSNEIAVLLNIFDAKRLLDVVNGGQQPLSDSERAGVARAFHDGFHRSGQG